MVANKKEYLIHRKVWSDAYGEIPAGRYIHHIDGDHDNNILENLQCVTQKEHGMIHARAGTDINNGRQLFVKDLRERKRKIMSQKRLTIKNMHELDDMAFVEYIMNGLVCHDDIRFVEYLTKEEVLL